MTNVPKAVEEALKVKVIRGLGWYHDMEGQILEVYPDPKHTDSYILAADYRTANIVNGTRKLWVSDCEKVLEQPQ